VLALSLLNRVPWSKNVEDVKPEAGRSVKLAPEIAGKAPDNLVASIDVLVKAPALLILAFSTPLAWNFISLPLPSAFNVRCSVELFIVLIKLPSL
jgi:hypothetical protein